MSNLSSINTAPFTEVRILPNPVFIPAFLSGFPFAGKLHTGVVIIVTGMVDEIKQFSLQVSGSWLTLTELSCKSQYLRAYIVGVTDGNNYGASRSAKLQPKIGHKALPSVPVTQAAGELVSVTMSNLVEAPMVMEAEILTKFIASEVKKLPLPAQAVAIPIINALYIAAALLFISLRAVFILVPNPLDWKRFVDPDKPENDLLLASPLPTFTDYLITQQSVRLMEYFNQEVAS